MFGIPLPKNILHAYALDKIHGNKLWEESISKEINSLMKLGVFNIVDRNHNFDPREGWQYAPMRTIFTIKHDLRHKARAVLLGHITDASEYDTYAATVRTENVRLTMLLSAINGDTPIDGDVSTAYLFAYTKEKIYTTCGPEFGQYQGKRAIIVKALYGTKSAANAWWQDLSNSLRSLSFTPSKIDPSFWWKLHPSSDRYQYLIHHVDDFNTIGPTSKETVKLLKQSYTITGDDEVPSFYLGTSISPLTTGPGWAISAEKYLSKCLPIVEEIIEKKLGKQSTPSTTDWRPWEDDSPSLSPEHVNKYQKLIGIGIWLVTISRIDILFAISTLSRYTHIAKTNHMKALVRVFEYLNKTPKRGLLCTPDDIQWDHPPDVQRRQRVRREDMLTYYPDATEEIDPAWPEPKGKPLQITIFVDADHASNKADRRSITGMICFIGTMPYKWTSKRQTSVETSTFGAELAALRVAVEEAIAIRAMLHSIGVNIRGPVHIYCDNRAVVDNSSIPGSALKKKNLSISFHKARECVAAGICEIYHIESQYNLSDLATKSLPRDTFLNLLKCFMFN